jgi:redox-sensitive bicupin YhaK (pirin superfamily)
MKTTLYKASTRGHADHGWLDTYHTFSFANYYDPTRIHFGALRVINDDIVEGGEGFGKHPHDNMEIISIPLYGALEHGDSMGNKGVIKAGDVQVMSAGTGVIHSEFNADAKDPVNFFQIWVFPNKKNVQPRYQQMTLDYLHHRNELQQVVSPDPDDAGLWIHQDAWFSIGQYDKDKEEKYTIKKKGNGVWIMVIEGEFTVAGQKLHRRDGFGISDIDSVDIKADTDNARILVIDVPMTVNA